MQSPHRLYIETVGCQMNMLDSEMVVASLKQRGYELSNNVADADTILFNTCSVREQAENKTYSALGRLCLLYTSPSPRDQRGSRMPSSA